jgi:hypothetical protein
MAMDPQTYERSVIVVALNPSVYLPKELRRRRNIWASQEVVVVVAYPWEVE